MEKVKRIRPKINPKDNTITIKKLKDSWNREEVIELFKKYKDYELGKTNWHQGNLIKWIEENL